MKGTIIENKLYGKNLHLIKIKLDEEMFEFKPGQFVMLSVPGFVTEKGVPIKRSYSIASAPEKKEYLEFTITRTGHGMFSDKICDSPVNTEVVVDGPFGKFHYNETDRTLYFIATGTGRKRMNKPG